MVSSTLRPYFTPGKDPVPIVQEAGWAPGPVWTGGKSRPTGLRSPDRPARSQSLYRLSYPAHSHFPLRCINPLTFSLIPLTFIKNYVCVCSDVYNVKLFIDSYNLLKIDHSFLID